MPAVRLDTGGSHRRGTAAPPARVAARSPRAAAAVPAPPGD